jgi:hypothetical protein
MLILVRNEEILENIMKSTTDQYRDKLGRNSLLLLLRVLLLLWLYSPTLDLGRFFQFFNLTHSR